VVAEPLGVDVERDRIRESRRGGDAPPARVAHCLCEILLQIEIFEIKIKKKRIFLSVRGEPVRLASLGNQ
jgi:hypothetical protein